MLFSSPLLRTFFFAPLRAFLCCLSVVAPLAVAQSVGEGGSLDAESAPLPDLMRPLHDAWSEARKSGKPVMLVLGAADCDRCVLLSRYLADEAGFRQQVDSRFVLHSLDVGSRDSIIEIEDGSELLPIVLLLDSAKSFESLMQADNLLTFLPEPHESIFDWFQNVLIYTEQNLAVL